MIGFFKKKCPYCGHKLIKETIKEQIIDTVYTSITTRCPDGHYFKSKNKQKTVGSIH